MLRVWMVRERGLDGEIGQLTHSGSAKKLPQRRTMGREGWDRLPKLQQKINQGLQAFSFPFLTGHFAEVQSVCSGTTLPGFESQFHCSPVGS